MNFQRTPSQTRDMFGDVEPQAEAQSKAPTKVPVISGGGNRQLLSKAQKTFNTLIRQIEAKRTELAAWEAAIPAYQRKYAEGYIPLTGQLIDLKARLVQALDQANDKQKLTKTEHTTIAQLIIGIGGSVVDERNDELVKAIYNKYSSDDYDCEEAERLEGMKAMIETMTGVDLDGVDGLDSSDEVFAHLHAEMAKEQVEREEKKAARKGAKKMSAKQKAREMAQQEAEQKISQSLREVYRKLASALHPDREPDPVERERKNALMQRVNQAYEKANLLQLLELQLELEHIDQAAIANLSEERLAHYNVILKEQLAELRQELLHVEGRFKAQFGLHPFAPLSTAKLMHDLDLDIQDLQRSLSSLEEELDLIGDAKQFKAWLKVMRQELREAARQAPLDDWPY